MLEVDQINISAEQLDKGQKIHRALGLTSTVLARFENNDLPPGLNPLAVTNPLERFKRVERVATALTRYMHQTIPSLKEKSELLVEEVLTSSGLDESMSGIRSLLASASRTAYKLDKDGQTADSAVSRYFNIANETYAEVKKAIKQRLGFPEEIEPAGLISHPTTTIQTRSKPKSEREATVFTLPELTEDQKRLIAERVAGISEEQLNDPSATQQILIDLFLPYTSLRVTRTQNILLRHFEKASMADILNLSEEDFFGIRNVGKLTLAVINAALRPLREARANQSPSTNN